MLNLKFKFKSVLNAKGLSLIEVLTSLGVSLIMILGMMTASREMYLAQNTADVGQDLTTFIYDVNSLLYNKEFCDAALSGKSSQAGVELELSPSIRAGVKNRKLNIQSVQLENIVDLDGAGPGPLHTAELVIRGERSGQVQGSKNFGQRFRLFYNVDGGNNIDSCVSPIASVQADCISIGGTWDETMSRCNMCEVLGGTLTDGVCSFDPPSGMCVLPLGHAWTVGGVTCNSDAAMTIQDGSSCELTDSLGAETGSAFFDCAAGVATMQAGATCVGGAPEPPGCVCNYTCDNGGGFYDGSPTLAMCASVAGLNCGMQGAVANCVSCLESGCAGPPPPPPPPPPPSCSWNMDQVTDSGDCPAPMANYFQMPAQIQPPVACNSFTAPASRVWFGYNPNLNSVTPFPMSCPAPEEGFHNEMYRWECVCP